MDLTNFAGKVAILVSVAVVLAFLALIFMAVFCTGLGAVDSVVNPHASQDTRQEFQNASTEINTDVSGMNQAVRNVTGGREGQREGGPRFLFDMREFGKGTSITLRLRKGVKIF